MLEQTPNQSELLTYDDVDMELAAPNYTRLASLEERLADELSDDRGAKALGPQALRAMYLNNHIDVSGGGLFSLTHDSGHPTLY